MSIDWETSRRVDLLEEQVAKIAARLSALEAAQKKPDAPTPEQREPGWYLFWYDGNPYPWEWCGRRWRSLTGALVSKHEGEEFAQRIQPPKGAA